MCRLMADERMSSIKTLFLTTPSRTYPQRRRTMRRNSGFFLLICLLVALSAAAQNITGTLQGTVTDPQGAAVPNAQVSIKNVATGEARTVTASSQGFYTAPELPVGTYDVTIKQPNFKTFISKHVELDASTTTTVNAVLQVGSVNEEVTVLASAIQVETNTGAVGNVVEGNEGRELPLNGSNFVELTQLDEVAPVQRQFANFVALNHIADRTRVRLHLDGARQHCNFLIDTAYLENGIYRGGSRGVQFDVLADKRLEVRLLDRHVVGAHRQLRRGVEALTAGRHRACLTGGNVFDRHLCIGHGCALRVRNRTLERSGDVLCGSGQSHQQADQQEET